MVEEFLQNLEHYEKPHRQNRKRSYYRHHRFRSIKRKMKIAKHYWFYDPENISPRELGRLNKGKIHCSCPLCRYEQYYGIDKVKYQIKEKEDKNEIKKYC